MRYTPRERTLTRRDSAPARTVKALPQSCVPGCCDADRILPSRLRQCLPVSVWMKGPQGFCCQRHSNVGDRGFCRRLFGPEVTFEKSTTAPTLMWPCEATTANLIAISFQHLHYIQTEHAILNEVSLRRGSSESMNRHLGMKPLRIVSIGGGTGLATLLRGLKRYARAAQGAVEVTAVVTVTDDGGSSGRLRRDFDVLPPGDIRNCMVALSQDEALLAKLFNYRFAGGRGLKGHSFGNLFLTAMTHLTGDFATAVRQSAEVLAVGGRIFPSTGSNVRLEATLEDGQQVFGESKIGRSRRPIAEVRLVPSQAKPLKETLDAIAEADIITLGPGSLFTSVIPNLLVSGIPRAIAKSTAWKVYFVNLMTQPGETLGLTASDHVRMVTQHCPSNGRGVLDICVVNSGLLGSGAVRAYGAKAAQPVFNDIDELRDMGLRVITTDLVRKAGRTEPSKIRHDSGALGAITIELAQEHRFEQERLLRKNRR